ncbi:hypothetical protein J2W92_002693 [Rhizobium leguminosarum]
MLMPYGIGSPYILSKQEAGLYANVGRLVE